MMFMSKRKVVGCAIALAVGAAGAAGVAKAVHPDAPLTKDAYKVAQQRIEQQGKAQRKACERLQASAKDVCVAQAKGREDTAKAQLEAQYKPSPEAEKLVKFKAADADYNVAKARCGAQPKGTMRERCLDQAKHDREAAIRLAKVEKVEEVNALKKAAEQKHAARPPASKS